MDWIIKSIIGYFVLYGIFMLIQKVGNKILDYVDGKK